MGYRPLSNWRPLWKRSLLISLLAISPLAFSQEEPEPTEETAVESQPKDQGLLPINELRTFADVFAPN